MKEIYILLFYKFIEIDSPEKLAKEQLELCKSTGLKGRILIAKEGINGSVSGTKEQIDKYIEAMRNDPRFSDMIFKEALSNEHAFKRISTHVKKEIVRFERPVNLQKKGKYLSPKEFLDLYKNNEDVVILDTRNDYEHTVGKFKKAITLNIETFKEFPDAIKDLEDKKSKKIVMYCTGGIRCEKASAFMVEQGFNNVYQLEGGILNFCKEFPDTLWEGKCFVFDKRLVSKVNKKDQTISRCHECNELSDHYRNCRNSMCDKLIILCVNCETNMKGCCSKDCINEFEKYCRKKAFENQGKSLRNQNSTDSLEQPDRL